MYFQDLRNSQGDKFMEDTQKINEICIYTRDLWALFINHKNKLTQSFSKMTVKMNLYTDGEYILNQKTNKYVFCADFIRLYEEKKKRISEKDFELLYQTSQKNTDKMIFFSECGLMKRNVTDRQIKVIAGKNE